METYFNIRYEFDKAKVESQIDERLTKEGSDYICVSDGVILNTANRKEDYLKVVNGGMFSICDSSFVPLYIKWIHGKRYEQYCGSQIFEDIIRAGKHRMIFMGTSKETLYGLKSTLTEWNSQVADMQFIELPFKKVEEFDYKGIAETIEKDGAEIIWVALGAPKQEWFMHYLKPHLNHGVMIAVGAAFKFFSGIQAKRAPEWMVKRHMEFVYRIFSEPKKQIRRCSMIIATLPSLFYHEWKRKKTMKLS